MRKICIFLLVVCASFVSYGQVNPTVQDTVKKGYTVGKLQIKDPKSILSSYTYDPVTDRYVYTSSIDGIQDAITLRKKQTPLMEKRKELKKLKKTCYHAII